VSDEAAFPDLPDDRHAEGGWTETERSVETVFRLPTARVRGATVVFDDERTRRALREATGADQRLRFFFATGLSFEPPLPPGTGPAMALPSIRTEAKSNFADQLRERGLTDVSRGRSERVRVDSGDRAQLTGYEARLPVDGLDAAVDVAGWLGVWHGDGFRIAGGAYPDRPLATTLDVEEPSEALTRERTDYRDELLDLIRSVR
jgi:hypothetical protein